MNVPLLRQIIEAIQHEPRRLNMARWLDLRDDDAPCHTAACIAGHAVILSLNSAPENFSEIATDLCTTHPRPGESWLAEEADASWVLLEASRKLDLDPPESSRLFYIDGWPGPFAGDYKHAPSRAEAGAVAVARIEHFIKTEGRE